MVRDGTCDRENLKRLHDGNKRGIFKILKALRILRVGNDRKIGGLLAVVFEKPMRFPKFADFSFPLKIDQKRGVENQRFHLSAGGWSFFWASRSLCNVAS